MEKGLCETLSKVFTVFLFLFKDFHAFANINPLEIKVRKLFDRELSGDRQSKFVCLYVNSLLRFSDKPLIIFL